LNTSAKYHQNRIDPYNFELYRFKVGSLFLRHSVVTNKKLRGQMAPVTCAPRIIKDYIFTTFMFTFTLQLYTP